MMAPWQVWLLPERWEERLVLVISSDFHLRANVGRLTTVVQMTDTKMDLDYRVEVVEPKDGFHYWVLTDQIRTVSTVLSPTGWTLNDDEVREVKHALKHMVAFA